MDCKVLNGGTDNAAVQNCDWCVLWTQILIRDYGRRRLQELDEHNKRRLVKVSENVEKGGAVLKMVSSSTGFLKGVMELSLGAATASSPATATVDGSTVTLDTDDNDTIPRSQPANRQSFAVSSTCDDGGRVASGRLVKGLAWLRRRRRRSGEATPSSWPADRHWWRRNDQSTTTHATIPSSDSTIDRATIPENKRSRNYLFRGNNKSHQDVAARRVYEKRAKWLKRGGRVADSDDCRDKVVSDFPSPQQSDETSAETLSRAISIISDGQNVAAEGLSNVGAGADAELSDVQTEVVLDPVSLSTTKTPTVAGSQSHDRRMSTVVNDIQPASIAESPVLPPQESDTDCRVMLDDVQKRSIADASDHVGWSTTDHAGSSEASDVDVLCNEIGRLVADHMQRYLASITCTIY